MLIALLKHKISKEEISFHHIADSITHFIKDEFAIKDTKFSNFVFNKKELTLSEIKGGLIFYGKETVHLVIVDHYFLI